DDAKIEIAIPTISPIITHTSLHTPSSIISTSLDNELRIISPLPPSISKVQSLPVPPRKVLKDVETNSKSPTKYFGLTTETKFPDDCFLYIVVVSYYPQKIDEIPLEVGDIVTSRCVYDDGWCTGFNLSKQSKQGCFPLVFCKPLVDTLIPSNENLNINSDDISALPRQSSISEGRPLYSNRSSSPTNPNSGGVILKVILPYDRQKEDELNLSIGDSIEILQNYSDGWGFGRILQTDMITESIGFFPLNFCTIMSSSDTKTSVISETLTRSTHSGVSWLIKNPTSKTTLSLRPLGETSHYQLQSEKIPLVPDDLNKTKLNVSESVSTSSSRSSSVKPWNLPSSLFGCETHLSLSRSEYAECLMRTSSMKTNRGSEGSSESEHRISAESLQLPIISILKEYIATRTDELSVFPGQQILIFQTFNDGWAVGLLIHERTVGMFPLWAC
ncbi:SH3-domain kinase binding protein 1, partial [Nowakowskiella sp. JEL0078]